MNTIVPPIATMSSRSSVTILLDQHAIDDDLREHRQHHLQRADDDGEAERPHQAAACTA